MPSRPSSRLWSAAGGTALQASARAMSLRTPSRSPRISATRRTSSGPMRELGGISLSPAFWSWLELFCCLVGYIRDRRG
ncbi:uncharacterized protein PHACADRAFT_255451 [Phanerochaete carnosa HHB-10118-sp]|uniref:Uncharacterized protein n=1 Tax=Phanerochaete carnosa (strain HHB-10118-sp) TaxID=650164 RepID=K5VU84_PHACS|nr:uncharacterized protein PHACADRAFT_255451 [Phanerochaete carnosa HHB-10118-sp]EKM55083.1 hypothetical protein PHACADRAFT_255451 [Phanerochaete carnosa HHB-10118-sp]